MSLGVEAEQPEEELMAVEDSSCLDLVAGAWWSSVLESGHWLELVSGRAGTGRC